VERYAVKGATPTMSAADWRTSEWRQLPARRIDLIGEVEEALTIQWAGSLPALQSKLLRKGWRTPAPWTSLSALAWLSAKADPGELPVVPRFASGELPSLTLVLQKDPAPNVSRFVLRMWPADLEITDGAPSPLWVGSVVEERLDRPLSLFTFAWTQRDVNTPRKVVTEALQLGWLVSRVDSASEGWDGRVLLIEQGSLQGPQGVDSR
jgi:undecaprenyl-diphosphatase